MLFALRLKLVPENQWRKGHVRMLGFGAKTHAATHVNFQDDLSSE